MARRRKLWIPKSVKRIKGIIYFLISTHPTGLAVLSGQCPFPSPEELHEMIAFSQPHGELGVRVGGGQLIYEAQRKIETLESEATMFDVLKEHGGTERLYDVVKDYEKAYPKNYQILVEIGNRGKPGARSLEAIAGKNNMDCKTLRNLRDRIIEEIAMGVVFYGDEFRLF